MSNVTSITMRREDEETGWEINLALAIPVDTNETWLSLVPLYAMLQTHLHEPCVVLSTEQAEHRAKLGGPWSEGPSDVFDEMYGIRGLGYPLEEACRKNIPLVVAANPKHHAPCFGTERDEISIKISRRHECGWGNDPWEAMSFEDRLSLSLKNPDCGWFEEEQSSCGFMLTLTVIGNDNRSEHAATVMADYLRQAYQK